MTAGLGNPLLERFERWRAGATTEGPDAWQARFGFAVPDDRALDLIARHSPGGVVEIGAGTGYWARLLADRGVDVVAYDIAPPPAPDNSWFAGQQPWHPVIAADERIVTRHADRTLLLVWPTRDEDWAADAALLHLEGGGRRLVYVGEPPGGRSGDARLHAVLGLAEGCLACAYGVTDVPCTCGVGTRWTVLQQLPLPRWGDREDTLYLCAPPAPAGSRRRRRFRR